MTWKYFSRDELQCKCGCGQCEMHEEFMDQLIRARELAGVPFKITSGYRCESHDAKFGSTGNHRGWAADIQADVVYRLVIVKALILAGFERIGISNGFMHCDAVPLKTKALWLY